MHGVMMHLTEDFIVEVTGLPKEVIKFTKETGTSNAAIKKFPKTKEGEKKLIISIKEVRNFIISILIPLIIGYLSNSLSSLLSGVSTSQYYSQLIKPSFAPPGYIFPIVWTILYVLMGISAYKILKKGSIFFTV